MSIGKKKNPSGLFRNLENSKPAGRPGSPLPEKKEKRSSTRDEVHSSPHLLSLSQISQRERVNIERYSASILKNPGLIGVIRASDEFTSTLLPVAFIEGNSEPVIVRSLTLSSDTEENIQSSISTQNLIFRLEELSIAAVSDRYVYIRSYVPLTLEDLLASHLPVHISTLFNTLLKLIYLCSELYRNNLVHGHIHPGNVVYGGAHDGQLIDYGVSLLERANKNSNSSFAPEFIEEKPGSGLDSYGLGYVIKRVLNEVRLIPGENVPLLETLQSSFAPLISALMNTNPGKRPNADLARLMFLDVLPMVYPDFTYPEIELHSFAASSGTKVSQAKHSESEEGSHSKREDSYQGTINVDMEENTGIEEYMNVDSGSAYESKKRSNAGARLIVNLLFFSLLALLFYLLYHGRDKFYVAFQNILYPSSQFEEYEVGDSFEGPYLGYDSLRAAWASQIPSRMKTVARQAVHVSPERELAEQVILTSLRQNEISSELVDTKLLRVAFNDQWEDQLDELDRIYALALGLTGVLRDTLPPGLGNIEERHPTILLSILSAGNEKAYSVLKSVPAEKLMELPAPYGAAFQILLSGREGVTCADQDVIALAHFSTRGIESSQALRDFLGVDFQRRISALSVVYSFSSDTAKKLLDSILHSPNFSVKNKYTEWGRRVRLDLWEQVDAVDKLFLLAGVPIKNGSHLDPVTVTDLFLHPAPDVRKFAIQLGLDKIEFQHPASLEVLQYLQDNPERVNEDQLVSLVTILHDPEKTFKEKRGIVSSFIESKPDIEVCKKMLLGTSRQKNISPLDAVLLMYLSDAGWSPDPSELLLLSEHPDKVTRIFAYKKLFELDDSEHALLLLKGAYEREKVPEFKGQLKDLIHVLSVASSEK